MDEVGQYIAENTKLMTNMQTVAESLATKCQGRAWIIVTAQEDMNSVLGDMSKQQSNDFSKIQARFANRLKLTSADVAEVIQKRLLTKNQIGTDLLIQTWQQQSNHFKTLFDFADGGTQYQNYRDVEHFVYCYPFVPYQFPLFQSAIRGLSQHNGFEGKANSVGERSMLGVFRDVAIAIENEPVGQLATFDRMFEGIRGALKSAIQSAINNAERHLGDPYAVRVLKALFLVKYVKEFKAILKGFEHLIQSTYPNLRMLRDVPYNEADIGKHLRMVEDGLLVNDNANITEPEQEMLAFIHTNAQSGTRTTVKSLLERFERKSYGWYYAAILCNLALLCARGKVEVLQDTNTLERDALERSLRNTNAHASLVLEPQVEFTASQVRTLKDFFADFF